MMGIRISPVPARGGYPAVFRVLVPGWAVYQASVYRTVILVSVPCIRVIGGTSSRPCAERACDRQRQNYACEWAFQTPATEQPIHSRMQSSRLI